MYKIGVDPEMFVVDSKKQIVPAVGLIGGSKYEPRKVERGALQEDNVMAEINIEPAVSRPEFVNNIKDVLRKLDEVLQESGHSYDKTFRTSYTFTDKQLEHPQASTFGCDPDMNVYSAEENPPIERSIVGNMRMCGGHIHLGFDDPDIHPMLRSLAVRWMDILVGIPLRLLDPDDLRPKFYGKAGNYRVKEYGIEYRTPSNFWLSDPELINFVFDQSIRAMSFAENIDSPERTSSRFTPEDIRLTIDERNRDSLIYIASKFGVPIPSLKKVKSK